MKPTQEQSDMTLSDVEKHTEGTFWAYLGIRPILIDAEQAVAELDIEDHHLNVMGVLHGGVHASLLDSVMGAMAMACRPGQPVVTSNLNMHYTAPVSKGKIVVTSKVVHESGRTITTEGRVTDETGRLLAFATGTFRVAGSGGTGSSGK